jgi:hypothetical protein
VQEDRSMIQRIACCGAALMLLFATGCASSFADPTGRLTSLEDAQRRYTQLVRWGELKRASAYVEPELVADFLSYEPHFDQIRIIDVDASEVNLDPSEDSASVEVTYHAYSYATFQEKRIFETQVWTRYDGVKNVWLVRPQLDDIVEAFHAGTH